MSVKYSSLKTKCYWAFSCGPQEFCQEADMHIEIDGKDYDVLASRIGVYSYGFVLDSDHLEEDVPEYDNLDDAINDKKFGEYFKFLDELMDQREAVEFEK